VKRALLLAALLTLTATGLLAHEVRPAYLELRQTSAETYDALWKVPGRGDDLRLGIYVRLPENCSSVDEVRTSAANSAFTDRWSVKCADRLTGGAIYIEGLSSTVIDVLVRVERMDGATQVARLTPSSPSVLVEAAPRRLQVAQTYLALGIEHILTGVDHLLFVSGLLLLVSDFRRLVLTISAFTVSHSVTLSLAALGYVHVPPAPVEAVIALSILFVACEILRGRANPPTLAQRKPWLVAFSFGLLHGLGFAGGLSEAGLPAGHIPLALALFSAGVELGHFSFVAAVLGVTALGRRWLAQRPPWTWRLAPYAIGSVAAFWAVERVAGFWR
jgi:hydrogenase/urease accessory protein HupE